MEEKKEKYPKIRILKETKKEIVEMAEKENVKHITMLEYILRGKRKLK